MERVRLYVLEVMGSPWRQGESLVVLGELAYWADRLGLARCRVCGTVRLGRDACRCERCCGLVLEPVCGGAVFPVSVLADPALPEWVYLDPAALTEDEARAFLEGYARA